MILDKAEYLDEEKIKKVRHEILSVLAENQLTFRVAKYCLNEVLKEVELLQDDQIISIP